jgi:hypothetical protein
MAKGIMPRIYVLSPGAGLAVATAAVMLRDATTVYFMAQYDRLYSLSPLLVDDGYRLNYTFTSVVS